MLDFNIKYYMVAIIITYIPFHLLEEALGNFPQWMKEHKWIPEKITYGHWMANNLFFYFPILIIGMSIFQLCGNRFLFIGLGIIFWGIINCLDHIVYTIIDRKVSPGIFTGLVFGCISIAALLNLYLGGKLSLMLTVLSLVMGLVYAFLPIILSMIFHKRFKTIFV